jgi:hypothetical protein
MIYRAPGFRSYDLAPPPLPVPSLVSKLSIVFSVHVCHRLNLLTGEGGGGAKSYDREKAWFSINHSILSSGTLQGSQRSQFRTDWPGGKHCLLEETALAPSPPKN